MGEFTAKEFKVCSARQERDSVGLCQKQSSARVRGCQSCYSSPTSGFTGLLLLLLLLVPTRALKGQVGKQQREKK